MNRKHEELNNFINGLSFPTEEQPNESVKIAEELSDLPMSALLEMAGYDTRSQEQKTAEAAVAEKRSGLRCSSMGMDNDFLAQFEGSPLYSQAIALAEQELELEKQQIAARIKRRTEDRDDSWEQESQARDMIDVQKRQLELELHKSKAQMAQAAVAAPAAAPAAALPAEAPPEAAAKVAAMTDPQQEKGLGRAVSGLAKAKMDPDRKKALAKGLVKAVKKEKAEGDPMKLSAEKTALRLPSTIQKELKAQKVTKQLKGFKSLLKKTSAKKTKAYGERKGLATGLGAFSPGIGGVLGGAVEARRGHKLEGALRGGAGSLGGGMLGTTAVSPIVAALANKNPYAALAVRAAGGMAGGGLGAHLATRGMHNKK